MLLLLFGACRLVVLSSCRLVIVSSCHLSLELSDLASSSLLQPSTVNGISCSCRSIPSHGGRTVDDEQGAAGNHGNGYSRLRGLKQVSPRSLPLYPDALPPLRCFSFLVLWLRTSGWVSLELTR